MSFQLEFFTVEMEKRRERIPYSQSKTKLMKMNRINEGTANFEN